MQMAGRFSQTHQEGKLNEVFPTEGFCRSSRIFGGVWFHSYIPWRKQHKQTKLSYVIKIIAGTRYLVGLASLLGKGASAAVLAVLEILALSDSFVADDTNLVLAGLSVKD